MTQEVGQDFVNMGSKKVCVVTDPNVKTLPVMKTVTDALTREGVDFIVYDGCRVEPKDSSYVLHPYFKNQQADIGIQYQGSH